MEIGSTFELTQNATNATNFRSALWAIIDAVKPTDIWLPDYFCPSVHHNLTEAKHYKVWFSDGKTHCVVPPLKNGDLFVAVNYFGFQNNEAFEVPNGVTVVEDMSMSAYLEPHQRSDFWIINLRKFFPLPDGALVFSRKRIPLKLYLDPPEEWWATNLSAMSL